MDTYQVTTAVTNQVLQVHGVAMCVHGCGVLIIGDSSSGKSELGLELIDRGHKFIADDVISISIQNCDLILANPNDQHLMHIRDLGFVDIECIYGKQHITNKAKLELVISLDNQMILDFDPLTQAKSQMEILGIKVYQYSLTPNTTRHKALLVELIIKYHQQLIMGYDSHANFIAQHTLQHQKGY